MRVIFAICGLQLEKYFMFKIIIQKQGYSRGPVYAAQSLSHRKVKKFIIQNTLNVTGVKLETLGKE